VDHGLAVARRGVLLVRLSFVTSPVRLPLRQRMSDGSADRSGRTALPLSPGWGVSDRTTGEWMEVVICPTFALEIGGLRGEVSPVAVRKG
jgi:hypothetical protein